MLVVYEPRTGVPWVLQTHSLAPTPHALSTQKVMWKVQGLKSFGRKKIFKEREKENSWVLSVFPGPAATTSPGNLLKMQILDHSSATEFETKGGAEDP